MAFEYTGGGVVENFVRRPESCLRANVTNEEHITTTDWFIEDTCGSNSSCGTCAADVLRSRGPSFCEKMGNVSAACWFSSDAYPIGL